jgi:hypothetical protein
MFREIWQGPGGHITWLAGQVTWPGDHNFTHFSSAFWRNSISSLHHSISEDFLTWCSKAHQVRYNICFQLQIL